MGDDEPADVTGDVCGCSTPAEVIYVAYGWRSHFAAHTSLV